MTLLDFDQSYEENKAVFVQRLVEAGWTEQEAAVEYERVQQEPEGDF
jgi:hypothetical protein